MRRSCRRRSSRRRARSSRARRVHRPRPRVQERIAQAVATRTRDEWTAVFEGSDACVTPVLGLAEAPLDAHNVARGAFAQSGGAWQPQCAPRFVDYGGESA
ncbi:MULTISPECIES: CoA transferase [Paraburkholderia]|uniref:CoA transferase n=1 Tax=Paraburkholderia TaxID=1822464 RepID=UPI0034CF4C2B